MKKWICSLIACAGIALAAPVVLADDDDVAMEQLPDPVRQAVEREVGDGEVREIERDRHQGRVVYEVEFVRNNQRFELEVSEDGRVLRRQED